MKLWVGICIGVLIGFFIGTIFMNNTWGELVEESMNTTGECIDDLIECNERSRSNIDKCEEYIDSCYDIVDNWKELFDDLMNDNNYEYSYSGEINYGYDYETEDFMVIEGIEYDCTYNRYNCIDFPEWADAQTLFIYCKTEGRGDIHYLDGDDDGIACENLYYDYGESNLNFGLL